MANETIDVVAKSEHIKNLRAEIDRLESDKNNILEWVKGKEKEVNVLAERSKQIQEVMVKDAQELEKKKKEFKDSEEVLVKRQNYVATAEKDIANKVDSLNIEEQRLKDWQIQLNQKALEQIDRENGLIVRENYIKGIFEKIKALS